MKAATYAPALEVDETLYSWCAASCQAGGWLSEEKWASAMLGSAHAARQHDIPAYLPSLMHAGLLELGIEQALRRHTVIGIFWPFVAPAFKTKILRNTESSTGHWGMPAMHVRRMLLAPSRTLPIHMPLKGCQQCLDADIGRIGRAYWHVGHQLPTVSHCPEHGIELQVYPLPRKRWSSPCRRSPNQPRTSHEAVVTDVASLLSAISQSMCAFDSIDAAKLRRFATRRLRTIGALHSSYAVRHARLQAWFQRQPVALWCLQHCAALADGAWLHRLLWRHHQDHAVRWVVAWAALEWSSSAEAVSALNDSQLETEVDELGQFGLFWGGNDGLLDEMQPSLPLAFQRAIEREDSYAGLMRRLDASRADVVRWFEMDPDARMRWNQRLKDGRIACAETAIRTYFESNTADSRQDLDKALDRHVRMLRLHAPERLDVLMRTVPGRLPRQPNLF